MAYFRTLEQELGTFLELFTREEGWLILINADPDALASAKALKRIMAHRVRDAAIAHVNEVGRPDNLAMIHHLRIPTQKLTPNLAAQYDRFAMVDSQPHHHPDFQPYTFSLVLDHHPASEENPVIADYKEIRPEYGACASMLTEYLYNLRIRPGKRLATALLYGIKNDTRSFERNFCDVDVRAFRYLSKFSNPLLLRKIVRSEFKLEWLEYFSKAFSRLKRMGRYGMHVYMGEVENPDILVILADFLLRVHDVSWTAVAGVSDGTLVAILRGDGLSRDMGAKASALFEGEGGGGGHKTMARAEVSISALEGEAPEAYVWARLCAKGVCKLEKAK